MASTSSDDTAAAPEPEPPPQPPQPAKRRRLETFEIAKVLALHLRAYKDGIDRSKSEAFFGTRAMLPHAIRKDQWLVDMRKSVCLILQLKTYNGRGSSTGLQGEGILQYTKMKLSLSPVDDCNASFVTESCAPKGLPGAVPTKVKRIFAGRTDPTGSFAIGEMDAHGLCKFEFKILLLNSQIEGREPNAEFRLCATPLDLSLQAPQLTWRSRPFLVKSQINKPKS
mgnify:FL=1